MYHRDFTGGPNRARNVNLSTSTPSSSASILNAVRAERQAREEDKRKQDAILVLQKHWRARRAVKQNRDKFLAALDEEGQLGRDAARIHVAARALVVILWDGVALDNEEGRRRVDALERWAKSGTGDGDGSVPPHAILLPLSTQPTYIIELCFLSVRMLEAVALNPKTAQAGVFLSTLDLLMNPQSYTFLPETEQFSAKAAMVEYTAKRRWLPQLSSAFVSLLAATPPKKKHPHTSIVARLVTAPFTMAGPQSTASLLAPILYTFLPIPGVISALPLPAITSFCVTLPLFDRILPLVSSASTDELSQGLLGTEMGKTNLLANLVTLGLTGGLLKRQGQDGIRAWMQAVAAILDTLELGWGCWVDGLQDDIGEEDRTASNSDDEDEEMPYAGGRVASPVKEAQLNLIPKRAQAPRRAPIAKSLQSRLQQLPSVAHLSILVSSLMTASSTSSSLAAFASLVSALLNAFRGSPKWEVILDALLSREQGKRIVRKLWLEGVRGRWRGQNSSGTAKTWLYIQNNASLPSLVLLSQLYTHFLLLAPDDEFFNTHGNSAGTQSNPLTLDEVLDLASIWRDLAFWGYTAQIVASSVEVASAAKGTDELRALFTRGVMRVAERNSRRKFAEDGFWEMSHYMDMKGFAEAAIFEEAELANPDPNADEGVEPGSLPRWALARHRYSKRQIAYISPRLGLLNNLPMTVPFETRLDVFRAFVKSDRQRLGIRYHSRKWTHQVQIRRESIVRDGYAELNALGPALKGHIMITFVDKWGNEEAGIDGGGLFKEFLTSLSKEAFDTNRGLWLSTSQNQLYPNPHSYSKEGDQLSWYGFIGRVLGKALYEGILVDVSFAGFFLAKWLDRQSYLDDLNSLDPELYRGLITLKNYPEPEELSLYFTLSIEEFGETKEVELVPGGADIQVTAANRHEYIQLVCKYKLDKQIAAQSRAFFNGLADIIDPKWLRMFDQQELQMIIGGTESDIDIDDLRENCNITGFMSDLPVKMFWKVVKGFSQEERQQLLRFVTSCSRPPLLGFSRLTPQFGIRCSGEDVSRLPSASSCFNLLKLPPYPDEHTMRTKLLQAITSGAGFDLS